MVKQNQLNLPVEVVQRMCDTIDALNPGVDMPGVIVIACKEGMPPMLSGNIPPEQMYEVFQWLLDHADRVKTEVHDLATGTRADN